MLIQTLYRFFHILLFGETVDISTCAPSASKSAVFSYKDQLVRKVVWNIKYRKNKKCIEMAGLALYTQICTYICANKADYESCSVILVPVPMSKNRLRKRGYNQAELLVEEVLRQTSTKELVLQNGCGLVIKIKETRSQAELTRAKRKVNLVGAFIVPYPEKVTRKNIVIIDDVTTTGSTFAEIKKVLLEAGANKVFTLALAH